MRPHVLAVLAALQLPACFGSSDDEDGESPAETAPTRDECLAVAIETGRWPEGCSDADPPGPHSPLGLGGRK